MMTIKLSLMMMLLSTLLLGCGGGSSSDNNGGDGGTTDNNGLASIISFDVKGTSADNTAGEAPLSPSVNAGKWSMDWEVDLKDSKSNQNFLSIIIYVSEDNKLSSTDIPIYRATCSGSHCVGKTKLAMSCFHKPDSIPDCEDDALNSVFISHDLETFLNKIPKSGHFIFTASGIDAAINDKLKSIATHPVIFE